MRRAHKETVMPTSNVFQDLKTALTDFKAILDTNAATIKPAIQALKAILPQAGDLVSQLITLLNQLKTNIQNLDVSNVTGLPQLSSFATSAETLLLTAENLMPDQESKIDTVLGELSVIQALPSLDAVKQDILTLIDGIIGDLNSLNL